MSFSTLSDNQNTGGMARSWLLHHSISMEEGEVFKNTFHYDDVLKRYTETEDGLKQTKGRKGKNRKKMFCHICNKHVSRLNRHLSTHSDEKKFQCTICENRFTEKGSLRKHLLIHSGEKKFQCKTCDKQFTEKGSLTWHLSVHSDEKKFQCTTCERRFKQRGTLRNHLLIHRGEGKFPCTVCDKRLTRKAHLNRHLLMHNDMKFQCIK